MTRTGVCVVAALLVGCGGAVGDTYQCRVTKITDEQDGTVSLDMLDTGPQFVFTVETESDMYVSGKVDRVWRNRYGELPSVSVSKLDGKFHPMQVQLSDHTSVHFNGFCAPQR